MRLLLTLLLTFALVPLSGETAESRTSRMQKKSEPAGTNRKTGKKSLGKSRERWRVEAGEEWIPLDNTRKIIPGSPMDFSNQLDAPAGKYGRVIISPEGHFTFAGAPEKRIRFVGVNLCLAANFLSHEEADQFVEYLVRSGYNSLRIHHHDNKHLLNTRAPDSLTIDADRMDKLDYLFHLCKKRGIYITTDSYVSRMLVAGDNIPEWDPTGPTRKQMKGLLPFSDAARENYKEFARRFLLHRNPYTGLTWLEDPALYMLGMTNENFLEAAWKQTPKLRALYTGRFCEWMKQTYPQEAISPAPTEQDPRFKEFLHLVQMTDSRWAMDFFKRELAAPMPLFSMNHRNWVHQVAVRDMYDMVDIHAYHDAPRNAKRNGPPPSKRPYPRYFTQRSSAQDLGAELPNKPASARIFGKPFSCSEFRFCAPNRFRCEEGIMMGAYAAFQDWDALHKFAYSHVRERVLKNIPHSSGFDLCNDPIGLLSCRIEMLLFRRGDVRASSEKLSYIVKSNPFAPGESATYPAEWLPLGFLCGIGNMMEGKSVPGVTPVTREQAAGDAALPLAGIEKLRKEFKQTGKAISSTGELRLDSARGSIFVDTARSCAVSGEEPQLQAGRLKITGNASPRAVFVTSLDGNPLEKSRKILVFHLTDMLNSGAVFNNRGRQIMYAPGEGSALLRSDRISVELTLVGTDTPEVVSLHLSGESRGKIDSTFTGGKLAFTADNSSRPGGVLVYLITR